MASTLVHGKYVICKAKDSSSSEVVTDGAVMVQDGSIVDVGDYMTLRARYTPDEELGSRNQLVMPGLINAHHHIGLTPFQLGVLDLPLELWIPARMAVRDVDPYLDTLYCAMQMIESGITTVMHNHNISRLPAGLAPLDAAEGIIGAYRESGMRVAFSFSYRDQNRFVYEEDSRFLETLPRDLAAKLETQSGSNALGHEDYFSLFGELVELYGGNHADQRIRHLLSPANVQWCSDSLLASMKSSAQRFGAGLHIHLQETVYQKMYGLRHYGKTPLAHLDDLGFLGPEVSCAHGVWLTEEDLELLADTGTCVCHNPSSNLRLKSGIAPLNTMLDKGVTVALGIDEAGINDDNDILQEMRLAQKLHRVPGLASRSPSSHQILHMATVNGAQATFFADQVGTLEVGKRADLLLVNLDSITEPYLDPDTDIVDALLYRGKGLDVDTVLVDGEVLLRNRQFTKVDKAAVWAELKSQLDRELQPHEQERRDLSKALYPYVQHFYQDWSLEHGTPHYRYNEAN